MQGVLGKCLTGTHPELSTCVTLGTTLEERQQVAEQREAEQQIAEPKHSLFDSCESPQVLGQMV